MKKYFLSFLLFACTFSYSQIKPFRFAFISDTHIGSPNGASEEDLRRTVKDVNAMNDVDFVVITGDITELGTNEQLKLAKQLLDSFNKPWYIIPGNHDAGWSESGGDAFAQTFGNDKFVFDHDGIRFIGCASGPYVRMSDGHVPRSHINWLDSVLKKTPDDMPVIFLNHYPMDNQMDNWYEVIDRLKTKNTIAILCGHGHANKYFKGGFEDIPGVMGRSNLRAKDAVGGYNLVDVRTDSIIFRQRKPGIQTLPQWAGVKIEKHNYTTAAARPDFSINNQYNYVKSKWLFQSDANVISTPVISNNHVIFGNQSCIIQSLSLTDGKKEWSYKTGGAIFSSPAAANGNIILGSADSYVYCLTDKGKLNWKFKTDAAVLGCPVIENNTVYIGGSDHHFRALDLKTGKQLWSFGGLNGPVVSTPVINNDKIIFGAWDTNLYALNKKDGSLIWKWNNGSTVTNFSPASCIPVIHEGVVYVVAPDRYITALDVNDGKMLWRNNDATIRESIGISDNGQFVYGKTMNDTIVAYRTSRDKQFAAWKMNAHFGYEHVPSMLIEKQGEVFFGTRSGVVYSIDPAMQKINWAHKIDNSMVNTVSPLDKNHVIVSTMDGKVSLLEHK
ncbi:MAG: metallophosphoesterase [Chitinophagaceae bacterium]|nr:metallophosphoesterase [Chitinophagaceae bacterium]